MTEVRSAQPGVVVGQSDEAEIGDLPALVEGLGRCLAYADAEQDHVLAALISAAHEMAMAKLSHQVVVR